MKEKFAPSLPEPSRMVHALSQIGYKLENAIADLIDNSITAGASSVLIRFLHDGNRLVSLAIADDGHGMTERGLSDAMRFGSAEDHSKGGLGKFGMGLKLASLSHSDEFSVFTRRNGRNSGKRWTIENLASGWLLETLDSKVTKPVFENNWADLDLGKNGTVVLWDRLRGFPQHKKGIKSGLSLIERRLRLHLGLTFHRFIEDGRVHIKMDQQEINRRTRPFFVEIEPLNPFGYEVSGSERFPVRMRTPAIDGIGHLEFDAHIWPSKSEEKEYRLGKRAASHQGFYVYRNGRLIQAGGWNGLVHDDSEPHSSLARVCLDLEPKLDEFFGLNVQKSAVITPIGFQDAVKASESECGLSWEDYRKASISAYRQSSEVFSQPVPGKGFPRKLQQAYKTENGNEVKLSVSESQADPVEVDLNSRTIRVSSQLRNVGMSKATDSSWHAFTILLFETFSTAFARDSLSKLAEQKLHALNKSLSYLEE